MLSHDKPCSYGKPGNSQRSAGRAALLEFCGRLLENGRLQSRYDTVGHCLGSGGMGSVWAARISDSAAALSSGRNSPRRSAGTWVALKAIPFEVVEEKEVVSNLRECLSTFQDLSPVHVVRYDSFWLEEPEGLPPEIKEICVQRGWKPDDGEADPSGMKDSTSMASFARRLSEGGGEGVGGGGGRGAFAESLRFRDFGEDGDMSVMLSSRMPPTPVSTFGGESCGFIWETVEPSPSALQRSRSFTNTHDEILEFSGQQHEQLAKAPQPQEAMFVVLLIEMELMAAPPGEDPPGTERRLTLREWLQRPGRTLSDAVDVFSSLMLSVRHIHRKRLIHSDLKPDNIFIAERRDGGNARITAVRVGDFGLAGENQLHRKTAKPVVPGGTPGYLAPELSAKRTTTTVGHRSVSDKVDIFACAVILLELLLPPFDTNMERVEALTSFTENQVVPVFILTRLPKTRRLLQEMGEQDPMSRLSAEEICKRFDKEVRKELVRSTLQDCGAASLLGFEEKFTSQARSKSAQATPACSSQSSRGGSSTPPLPVEHPPPKISMSRRSKRRHQKGGH